MTASQQKVLQMVAEGTVTPDEGQQLLAALGARRRSAWSWLFNPMAALSTRWTLGLTAAVVLAAAFAPPGSTGARRPRRRAPAERPAAARRAARRAGGALGGVLAHGPDRPRADAVVARSMGRGWWGWAWLPRRRPGAYLSPLVMVLALVTVALVGWSITVLVMSYRTVTRLTGARLVVSLLAGLVVAEGASKLVWHWVA
ncbi:MAG: hypothetical protein IPJ65_15560 [Archangiaceae bacterium]|nr:hypothetical protein [Archangiaceae bacterium]